MTSQKPVLTAPERRARLMRRDTSVLADLSASLKLHELWRALAWEDLVQRYRRASLGVGWILISFLLMVFIFVFIFGRSSPEKTQFEYTLYLATGLFAWTFLSVAISQGGSIFGSNAGWIRASNAPLGVLSLSLLTSAFLEMCIVGLSVLPLVLLHGLPSVLQFIGLIAALVLYGLNLLWCSLFLGSIGAWSSDFQQLIPSFMRIFFFATPIFWDYDALDGRRHMLATYNPFTHFVELVRQPLMGNYPDPVNWAVAISITGIGWVLALIVFRYAKPRLSAWV